MKNPVAKYMHKTSRSSVMADRKKQSKIDPDMEEAMMLLDELLDQSSDSDSRVHELEDKVTEIPEENWS